jgi:hypothetical protein
MLGLGFSLDDYQFKVWGFFCSCWGFGFVYELMFANLFGSLTVGQIGLPKFDSRSHLLCPD